MKFTPQELKEYSTQRQTDAGAWVWSRPENWRFESIKLRVKHAWAVLRGKYDVVEWP